MMKSFCKILFYGIFVSLVIIVSCITKTSTEFTSLQYKKKNEIFYPKLTRNSLERLFNIYKTKITHNKLTNTVDKISLEKFRNYRTILNDASKEKTNFGGKYRIVTFGCGTECQSGFLIDLENGKIYLLPTSEWGLEFRANSLLIIENPPTKDESNLNRPKYAYPIYYIWKDKKLELLCDTGDD